MSILIPIFTQFLVGWLAQCGRAPGDAKAALAHNFDVGPDGSRVWDDDFVQAGRVRAKRAVRRLHKQDHSQPNRRSPAELDAMVVEQFNAIMDSRDDQIACVCATMAPLIDE